MSNFKILISASFIFAAAVFTASTSSCTNEGKHQLQFSQCMPSGNFIIARETNPHEAVMPKGFVIDNKVQHHAAPVFGKVVNKPQGVSEKDYSRSARSNC